MYIYIYVYIYMYIYIYVTISSNSYPMEITLKSFLQCHDSWDNSPFSMAFSPHNWDAQAEEDRFYGEAMGLLNLFFFLDGTSSQWEFQDPKMEVLYHIRPYFVGISPYIGLT